MKRVLVAGHSYVPRMPQTKWVAAAAAAPDLEISLMVPRVVTHVLGQQVAAPHPEFPAERYHTVGTHFSSNHMRQILAPWGIFDALRRTRPDLVHIEEDPYSPMGMEVFAATRILAPGAKISFFTWDNLARQPPFPVNLVKKGMTRLAFGTADLVVCGNSEAQTLLHTKKRYGGKSVVLPQLGVEDTPHLVSRRRSREISTTSRVTIGFIGRLIPEKGLRVLFEAFRRLSDLDVKLVVVGAGSMWSEIDESWREVLGPRLVLRKAVPHEAVPSEIADMDIFVLPSLTTERWKEQFGLTIPIAMLTAAACVGSSSAAIPDVIGDAGVIVPEGNAEALEAALRRLVTSPRLRDDLGRRALERARQHYTHDAVATKYVDAFRALLAQ